MDSVLDVCASQVGRRAELAEPLATKLPERMGSWHRGATWVLRGVHIAQEHSRRKPIEGAVSRAHPTSSPSSGFFDDMTREVRGHAVSHHAHVPPAEHTLPSASEAGAAASTAARVAPPASHSAGNHTSKRQQAGTRPEPHSAGPVVHFVDHPPSFFILDAIIFIQIFLKTIEG